MGKKIKIIVLFMICLIGFILTVVNGQMEILGNKGEGVINLNSPEILSSGNLTFNQTLADELYWKLSGNNIHVQSEDMDNYGFQDVGYTNFIDDILINDSKKIWFYRYNTTGKSADIWFDSDNNKFILGSVGGMAITSTAGSLSLFSTGTTGLQLSSIPTPIQLYGSGLDVLSAGNVNFGQNESGQDITFYSDIPDVSMFWDSVNANLSINNSQVCTADNGICPAGNESWNESRAGDLFYLKTNPEHYVNATTETDPAWNGNWTAFSGLVSNNFTYSRTDNATYDATSSAWVNNYTLNNPIWYNHTRMVENLYSKWFYNHTTTVLTQINTLIINNKTFLNSYNANATFEKVNVTNKIEVGSANISESQMCLKNGAYQLCMRIDSDGNGYIGG
jgi:hypothetical protein